MGCCNFGREDELFPFEEEAKRFIEGILPQWREGREFRVKTKKEELRQFVSSVKNSLLGYPEEEKLSYLECLLEKPVPEKNREPFFYISQNYLVPFLKRLVYYRANEPEGLEDLLFFADEILKELSTFKKLLREEKVELALDVLISALYQQMEG